MRAVLPDVDELQSPMGWRLAQVLPHPVWGIGQQRTHSLSVSVGVALVAGLFGMPLEWVAAAWVGWLSHVLLDACAGGVPFWWPWCQGPEHRVRAASWRIGGFTDYVLCCVAISSVLWLAWEEHWLAIWGEKVVQMVKEGKR
jgi:hypothetical protein